MQDPLKETTEGDIRNKDKFYYVLSYIPLIQFVLYFSDIDKSEKLKKHMSQGASLFIAYIICNILLGILWLGALLDLLGTVYIIGSILLGLNAYNGKYIHVPVVDELSDVFKGIIGGK